MLNTIGAEELHPKFELPTEPIKVAEMLMYATEIKGNDMKYFVDGKEISKEEADKIKRDNKKYMESNDLNQWGKKFYCKNCIAETVEFLHRPQELPHLR